jgi:ribonuclease VapC
MIAADTSELGAIVFGEAEADACIRLLEAEAQVLISAGTLAETLLVATRRNVAEEIMHLVDGLGFEVATVTAASARRIAEAYGRWGKGIHPAGLNFGDVLLMNWPRNIPARCSSSEKIFRKLI